MEVVGGSGGTEVGRDGGERSQEEEADGVPHQVPLVVPHGRGEEPAGEGPGVPRDAVLLVTELAGVLVDGGQPFLSAGPVDQTHGAGAVTRRDEFLPLALPTVTDAAEQAGLRQAGSVLETDRPRGPQAFGGLSWVILPRFLPWFLPCFLLPPGGIILGSSTGNTGY